jgi:hypothetical protein
VQDSENNPPPLEKVLTFLKEKTGMEDLHADTDLYAHGVTGKQFNELVRSFGRRFNVNTENYLWYFHTDEDGMNFGAIFVKPPHERVKRIPVTPFMFAEFAEMGSWTIEYPPHEIPGSRLDHLLNVIIVFAIAFLLVYVGARKF